jgi:hypothetical protein
LRRILPYLLFSLIIPVGAAALFYLHFRSDTTDIDPNMRYLLRPSSEQNDILFLGNSRVLNQIDPRIVEQVTGLKAYNLGLEGGSTVYFNMVYQIYMQRHPKPKYLVINADFRCFDTEQRVFNFPDYFPYLRDPMVYATLAPYYTAYQSGIKQFYYKMKRINSKSDPNKISNLKGLFVPYRHSELPLADSLRGFHPFDMTWESQRHVIKQYDAVYSQKGFDMLRHIIKDAQAHDIKVILICAPFYKDYRLIVSNYTVVRDSIINIAKATNVPYWNYSDIAMGDSTLYFYNVNHLNALGATAYSGIVSEDLRYYMMDNKYIPLIK